MSKLLSFDNAINKAKRKSVSEQIVTVVNTNATDGMGLGMESAQFGKTFLFNQLSKPVLKSLLAGESYLEMEVLIMDHDTPTSNRKYYPADVFREGIRVDLGMSLSNGPVGGEHEHPTETLPLPGEDIQSAVTRIYKRVDNIVPGNISHYIIGIREAGSKTYMTIRTSLTNRIIINEMLIGKIPTFSVRSRGDFEKVPDQPGYTIAKKLKVVTVDLVRVGGVSEAVLNNNSKIIAFAPATNTTNVIDFNITKTVAMEAMVGDVCDISGNYEGIGYKLGMESGSVDIIFEEVSRTFADVMSEINLSKFK